jgi:hypothetical protein
LRGVIIRTNKNKIEELNKIIKLEEGIKMATKSIKSTSADELAWLEFNSIKNSREYYANRMFSEISKAKAEGEAREKKEIVLKSYAEGLDPTLISRLTGLSLAEIEDIKNQTQ